MKTDVKSSEFLVAARSLPVKDIDVQVSELKNKVFWLNFKNRSGQAIKVSELQKFKKQVARLLTIKGELLRKGVEK